MTVTSLRDQHASGPPPPPALTTSVAGAVSQIRTTPLWQLLPYSGVGRRLAFPNNKGGVGKTAIVVALAAALARRGRRVLVLDFDPQGNATRRLGVTPDRFSPAGTVGDLLDRDRGAAVAAIVACGWDAPEAWLIDVLPADITLADRDLQAHQTGADNRLRRVLYHDAISDGYDYLLIDCRPTLGHLERMVVRALDREGDGYYVPIEPGSDAIGGAARCIEQVALWADLMEVKAKPLGVIVSLYGRTRVQHRGRVGAENPHDATADVGTGSLVPSLEIDPSQELPTPPGVPPILRPFIPRNARLEEIYDLGQPVSTTDRRLVAEGIIARYDRLAEQVDQ